MRTVQELMKRYYPADWHDGTLAFYRWLRQSVRRDFVVLNVGAGPTSTRRLRSLRGEAKRVVGVDLDEAVLQNEDLDEAIVDGDGRWPFPDETFDLAWADFVLEHVQEPEAFIREVHRVIKPGASFFFRTPNKYHYVALIARATPHWFHDAVANRVRSLPADSHEPYPTFYRLNSRRAIEQAASSVGFSRIELRYFEGEPSYLMFHPLPFLAGVRYERVVNRFRLLEKLRSNIFGRLEK